ncbi:16S rRNA (uracil(1498)-N(3))-methyltransferase [Bacillaceae bacterium SIJ1]|uniref:16S rRNA (uracil(1498)-N(3))-methyltransferase n=1 Tax=Litoribacterium kuwaitense TaxID=1398745 RepID=UPI0013EA75F5|nr:16S rRNA (uracil(1498)-N(3))-methyltransferase [Litoribacterium kuwaitense]NGP43511.1 16S rRNA (uracil(1498)-N(3))-methyltransferase [Litoribacterium kuwaitense]
MQRYFSDITSPESGKRVQLNEADSFHVLQVMRQSIEDQIEIGFANQSIWKAEIEAVESKSKIVTCVLLDFIEHVTEMSIEVTIVHPLLKGDKMEWMIQKATEMGASHFHVLQAERAVVQWDEKKWDKKRVRLQTIVKEAAEQSKRQKIPSITGIDSFTQILTNAEEYDKKWVAYEEEARREGDGGLKEQCQSLMPGDRLLVMFGPEGGFSDDEISRLRAAGFDTCRLGPRILRAETAPLYILGALSYQFES